MTGGWTGLGGQRALAVGQACALGPEGVKAQPAEKHHDEQTGFPSLGSHQAAGEPRLEQKESKDPPGHLGQLG